ncbi:MAG: hypothetical protein A3C08_02410 [Candidatus Taylorbacteria bacterium RIFCSPHIGHO2_02_FULL_47_18]|uniref:Reverse transcriptase domain-containing protein n=1 Tax=Candidatus Taylorbacteria bacterium RIFCSPLOWO2_01_FULL_48_100 TaxID=1802322 RepID=A0A1G2NFZ2_9BACT|nr:MAG: hypothetical protein A3C08_02410 [Candidatus Taylorbacteria bacterium RIFCSPHIGHO2_02_FULL_47_18]OHA35005.1 MAG: hypothetical protein A2938_01395 [Candidatus Taylorbacteria bacterium RIFCSPLOWO2_01_FULL_48_100]OHA40960.1 MAG: hypothetical protein A3J31_00120 [Candidatus Taylorbacteria bacterium RIFCSPLOWO2_02_FULL_48_16]OHA44703.1 MAG: hypothetical protein A3H13_03140 [Candidatus Taylorbacteria bacterium RIFCSPLOWO2_12_FULL_48_11]
MTRLPHSYHDIISYENLLLSWQEFIRGKRKRKDVQEFSIQLFDNTYELHRDLAQKTYRHGQYQHFKIADPKPRDIHKATVRDRLLHHAVYRILYPFFDKKFIADSFSCRLRKGTHRTMNRFRAFKYQASENHTRTCSILKCDIRKFFANIDHAVLLNILTRSIPDADILWLLREIIGSFNSGIAGKGLPLGNLTSQLFVNIYMNEFDQFVKHHLKMRYYIRYADDFVIFSQNKDYLTSLAPHISRFLSGKLHLALHPDKVFIKTIASGVDFLGWIHFPNHRVLRTTTKRRMFSKVSKNNLSSYAGLLKHGNGFKLQNQATLLAQSR